MKKPSSVWRLTAAAVAMSCVCGAVTIQADEPPAVELQLHLRIDRSIGSRVLVGVLASEADAIWRPYGLRIDVTESPDVDGLHGLSLEAIVERRMAGPAPRNGASALGRAWVDLTNPFRPIRASFEATEDLLETRPTHARAVPRIVHDHEMARALGRVLAHEIGHVLLGAPYHTAYGLMRPAYQAQELASIDRRPFELTCGDIARLHSRLEILTGAGGAADRQAVGTLADAGDAAVEHDDVPPPPPCRRGHVGR
jgi:hypothetical protein